MSAPVLVTGLGWIGPHGVGAGELSAALAAGRPQLAEVDRGGGLHRPAGARLAGLVPADRLAAEVPAALARRMSYPSRLAVAATRAALADAGLVEKEPGFATTAIVMATAYGPVRITEQLLDAILRQGPEQASPSLFTESVASAPASQMALFCRALGPNLTLTQRKAGPLLALAEGARLIARGLADRVLVGAVDELTPLLHALLDRFRFLARPGAAGGEAARPFDRRRAGAIATEGAAVAVLESPAAAAARGARVRARLLGAWGAFDPSAPPLGWGREPARLAAAARRGLARYGLAPDAVDRVIASASGSPGGDRLEAGLLRALFAGGPPPVLAPKGTLGEFGGGLLAAAVLAAGGDASWPTAGFGEPDPDLAVVPHDGAPLPAPRLVLASAVAAAGGAAWAVLSPP